ncbi:MAG TPA: transketolase C-terminal domain-containing protein, partial [Candidatus Limnocylindria bacterium]
LSKAIPKDQQLALHGPEKADVTIVAWGSTKGTILDAMRILSDEGKSVNFLQCRLMRPFPAEDVERILRAAKRVVLLEENYSGQLGSLIAEQTGIRIADKVLKFDGRPFSEDEVVAALRARLDGKAREGTDVVMTHVR